MPEGVIIGGWSFVVASYTVTAAVVVAYSIHLLRRHFAGDRRGKSPR